jgi:tRNA dimethylallyltransferase
MELSERLGGEIICCDSMQVYRGMDIGTAKATAADQAAIPHHLLDVASPDQQFDAAAWAAAAHTIIADAATRERLPIIVGGTGLYFRALVRGLFEAPRSNPEIRARHQAEAAALGTPALHARLSGIDPEAAAKIEPADLVRISRALEVFEQTGITISELRRHKAPPPPPLRMFSVVLDFDLDLLRPRIAARVDAMMAAGFVDEVRALRAAGYASARSMQALGYKQLGEHLDGKIDLETAVAETKTTTAGYARRQRTWFRREEINLRAYQPLYAGAVAGLVRGWLLT